MHLQVIQQMTSKGISSSSIGVICFFRAQVCLLTCGSDDPLTASHLQWLEIIAWYT